MKLQFMHLSVELLFSARILTLCLCDCHTRPCAPSGSSSVASFLSCITWVRELMIHTYGCWRLAMMVRSSHTKMACYLHYCVWPWYHQRCTQSYGQWGTRVYNTNVSRIRYSGWSSDDSGLTKCLARRRPPNTSASADAFHSPVVSQGALFSYDV